MVFRVFLWLNYPSFRLPPQNKWDNPRYIWDNPTNWTHYPCGSSCTQEVRLGYDGYDDWGVKLCTFSESGHGSIGICVYIYIQGGAPPDKNWFISPLTIDVSPINYSYWTYKLI